MVGAVNKYRAKKCRVDGHCFDSKREAAHYLVLRLLEKAGKVNAIQVHPRFDLHAHGTDGIKRKIGQAEMDFRFWDCERKEWRIQDVKGMDLPLSKWKRAHLEAEHGIKVELVK